MKKQEYYINIRRTKTHPSQFWNHRNNCLHYIVDGYGYLKIYDRTFRVCAGQCFFVPRGEHVSFVIESNSCDYIWISFAGDIFDEILDKIAFSKEDPICNATEEQQKYFLDIGKRRYTWHNGEFYHTIGLLILLLSSFVTAFPSERQVTEDKSIHAVMAFINNNLHRSDLTVALLAQITGLSRTTLCAGFQKEVGCAPSEYIREQRLNKAKHLLRTTSLSVKQISYAVGFTDPLYFSRVFHQRSLFSPSAYRKYVLKKADKIQKASET